MASAYYYFKKTQSVEDTFSSHIVFERLVISF